MKFLRKNTRSWIKSAEPLRASQSYLVSKGYINNLEKHSSALESKIGGLENEYLRLAKQNARLSDLKIMSEKKSWLKFSRKKGMFGKEHVELTKSNLKFKGLIYRSKNLVHEKELENDQLRRQMPLKLKKRF